MKKGLKVDFYNPEGKLESYLTAEYGISFPKEKKVKVQRNVEILNTKGETLNTEELIWDQETGTIHTDKFVKITGKDQITQGTGDDKVPAYSGSIARAWGKGEGPPAGLVTVGKNFLIKSAVQIKTWDAAVAHSVNGYGLTVASNYGFKMEADRNGFHQQSGVWKHQMCVLDIDDEWKDPYVIILNSWGDTHGKLYDFYDKTQLPAGCLRITRKAFEGMIRDGEVYAFCQYDQPKAQDVDAALFKLWNNTK